MASRSVESGVLRITDCSRGLSDWYPPRLKENQLAEAWDVEFWDGTVCGRRHGCTARVAAGAGIVGYSLFVHTPTSNRANDYLALAYQNAPTPEHLVNLYTPAYVPTAYSSIPDVLDFSQGVDWASLHGKLFIATKSNANRLHVLVLSDSAIRRTGLSAPGTGPTVVNTGAGAFANQRRYRIRWLQITGGRVQLRSEPSPETIFTPSGTGLAARITPVVDGGLVWVTHWSVEEMAVNGSWYAIGAPQPISPLGFYDDTLLLSAVPTTGVLSEDIGDYTVQYSARWLTVDEDRLLLGGSFEEEAKSARVSWTPLGGQVGVGNDERLPSDVDGYLDFDMLDGGGLTGIKAWEGKVIVFKRGQVHQMVRSSSRTRAYLPDTLSRRHGAISFSLVEGTDVEGLSCLYFLDPEVGPMQLGFKGLRVLAPELQRRWRSDINLNATVPVSVTYHPEKRQVWWHVATGSSLFPNRRWMYSVETDGVVFHTLPAPIKSATGWQQKPTLLHDTTGAFVTLIGQGDQPNMVIDYFAFYTYRAYVQTKAYQLGQLLRRFQIDSAILEGGARAGAVVYVKCLRDFGVESRSVPVSLTPASAVPLLTIPIDNSYMTEAISMQFEIGDGAPLASGATGAWQIHGLTLAWSLGSPTTGRG